MNSIRWFSGLALPVSASYQRAGGRGFCTDGDRSWADQCWTRLPDSSGWWRPSERSAATLCSSAPGEWVSSMSDVTFAKKHFCKFPGTLFSPKLFSHEAKRAPEQLRSRLCVCLTTFLVRVLLVITDSGGAPWNIHPRCEQVNMVIYTRRWSFDIWSTRFPFQTPLPLLTIISAGVFLSIVAFSKSHPIAAWARFECCWYGCEFWPGLVLLISSQKQVGTCKDILGEHGVAGGAPRVRECVWPCGLYIIRVSLPPLPDNPFSNTPTASKAWLFTDSCLCWAGNTFPRLA